MAGRLAADNRLPSLCETCRASAGGHVSRISCRRTGVTSGGHIRGPVGQHDASRRIAMAAHLGRPSAWRFGHRSHGCPVPGNPSHGQGADLGGSVEVARPCAVAGAGLPAFLGPFRHGAAPAPVAADRRCRPVLGDLGCGLPCGGRLCPESGGRPDSLACRPVSGNLAAPGAMAISELGAPGCYGAGGNAG
jgi:hypothetical protein